MKKILLILSFYLTLTLCCNAQKFISCDIEAGINNEQPELTTDTGGTNIRTGPGKNFAVLKTLKSETGFLFHITAAQDDWMQISSVFYIGEDRTKPLKGWIYAPSLFLKVGSNVNTKHNDGGLLFAAPNLKSRELLTEKQYQAKKGDAVSLLACQGKWVKVSWEDTIGWLNPAYQCAELWDVCGEM